MAKKTFVLACSLVQCLTMIGMDQPPKGELNKSRDNLSRSQGTLSRSQSQELRKLAPEAVSVIAYYDFRGKFSPCQS